MAFGVGQLMLVSTVKCIPSRLTSMAPLPVLLYVPNLLGYARIILAFLGLQFASSASSARPCTAVLLWIASGFLDLFDGILARALNQTSSLGVFLDIAADNILRTVVWVAVAGAASNEGSPASSVQTSIPCFIICLEWTTMVSTQVHAAQNATHWKGARERDPWLVRSYFDNNFRNPIGFLGIFGLFSANLFAYGSYHPILYENIPAFRVLMYLAFGGRFLSMLVELWFCFGYLSYMVEQDSNVRDQRQRVQKQH